MLLQKLGAPSCVASNRTLIHVQHTMQTPSIIIPFWSFKLLQDSYKKTALFIIYTVKQNQCSWVNLVLHCYIRARPPRRCNTSIYNGLLASITSIHFFSLTIEISGSFRYRVLLAEKHDSRNHYIIYDQYLIAIHLFRL